MTASHPTWYVRGVTDATATDNAAVKDGDESEAPPPQTPAQHAVEAAIKTLAYRDRDGEPIVPQPEHRDSWEQGAWAAAEAFVRLVPQGDPTAFAIEQMWLMLRALGAQLNVLTGAIAEVRKDTGLLVAKVDEYADVLPAPGSLMARVGRWGRSPQFPAVAPTDG